MQIYPRHTAFVRLVLLGATTLIVVALFCLSVPVQSASDSQSSVQPVELTPAAFLPLVVNNLMPDATPTPTPPPPVRFTVVGYNLGLFADNRYEHIHLCDSSASNTDIAGWRIHSPATGDNFFFPAGAKALDCTPTTETTVNTQVVGNENDVRIFTWGKPLGTDEWPDSGGVGYLYNASNQLISVCNYTPSAGDNGNATCY